MTVASETGPWRPRDTLAARFKLIRGELNMSQREFGDAVGIPASQIQTIEDGRSPRGLDIKVKKIALAFNVDRDWLMWGGELADPTNPGGGAPAAPNQDDESRPGESNPRPSHYE